MFKMRKLKILGGLLLVFLVNTLDAQQLTATEIVQKSEDNVRGKSNYSEMEINTIRPTWNRKMVAKSWSIGTSHTMIYILSPARDKGTVFLKRDKEIWNYVPTIERNVKLPPSMMMQSWMGTDFNNDDLVNESSITRDYEHTLLREETIRGFECYVIEFKPKPEAAVVWGKIIGYISKEHFLQIKSDFYDEYDELVQVMEGFDIKTFDGRQLPSRMRMTPMDKEGHYTEMITGKIDFDIDVEESFFTTQNMTRVR